MEFEPIRSLVLPLDGSEFAERALPAAQQLAACLARDRRLEVVLLNAPQIPALSAEVAADFQSKVPSTALLEAIESLRESAREEARAYLEKIAERFEDHGVEVVLEITDGPAAEVIVESAAGRPGALALLATHGRTGARRLVLGSVAERVVRAARFPLILVPAAADPAGWSLRRILAPLDGSQAAEAALGTAALLALAAGAELLLLHVAPDFGELAEAGAEALLEFEGDYARWAETYLEGVQERLAERGVRCAALSASGDVADTILATAAEKGADMVALSAKGLTRSEIWALGGVTERVTRHALVPVLVARG